MTTLRRELEAVEAAIGDPSRGIPDEVLRFISRLLPQVNVDLLIRDERGRTLLTWRDDELFGPGWHLPGSLIRYKESAAARVRACAMDELGADVSADAAPMFVHEAISPQRTRGHHVSLLYRCRLLSDPDPARKAGPVPRPGDWRWHEGAPADLIPIHRAYAAFM
jgi:colanic acid biosynthesis protein WcaH